MKLSWIWSLWWGRFVVKNSGFFYSEWKKQRDEFWEGKMKIKGTSLCVCFEWFKEVWIGECEQWDGTILNCDLKTEKDFRVFIKLKMKSEEGKEKLGQTKYA